MGLDQLLLFYEESMENKFDNDEKDLSLGFRPRNFDKFFTEFMINKYRNRSKALKGISQLVLKLTELYTTGHEYGILFNRMLKINHPDPID